MSRNFAIDSKVFSLKRDSDQIANLYHPHQGEVKQFLSSQNASGKLQGMENEQVYKLISTELGYSISE